MRTCLPVCKCHGINLRVSGNGKLDTVVTQSKIVGSSYGSTLPWFKATSIYSKEERSRAGKCSILGKCSAKFYPGCRRFRKTVGENIRTTGSRQFTCFFMPERSVILKF